jgi:hypothetical protein
MPQVLAHRDDRVAAVSSCPVLDCGSLVIEYCPAGSIRLGHSEYWEFTRSRCGMNFSVTQGELIFQIHPQAVVLSEYPCCLDLKPRERPDFLWIPRAAKEIGLCETANFSTLGFYWFNTRKMPPKALTFGRFSHDGCG